MLRHPGMSVLATSAALWGCAAQTEVLRVPREMPDAVETVDNGSEIGLRASFEGGALLVAADETAMCREVEHGTRVVIEREVTTATGCAAHPAACLLLVPLVLLVGPVKVFGGPGAGLDLVGSARTESIERPTDEPAQPYTKWGSPRTPCAGLEAWPAPGVPLTVTRADPAPGTCATWTGDTREDGSVRIALDSAPPAVMACADAPPPGCVRVSSTGFPEALSDAPDHPQRGRTSFPVGAAVPPGTTAESGASTALECETPPQMFRRLAPEVSSSPTR